MILFYYLGYIAVTIAILLIVLTTIGYVKFNNIYTQIHIVTVNDMITIPLIFLGFALLFFSKSDYSTAIKMLMITIIWFLVNSIVSYSLIKISYFYTLDNIVEKNIKINNV